MNQHPAVIGSQIPVPDLSDLATGQPGPDTQCEKHFRILAAGRGALSLRP
ncbi:Uncharacterised protein [Mycobacteroides abscessus subsp. massiliense]|nr:Uncharacterised protein [Mycobacteroides abscessus subsp. massiliense]